MEQLKWETKKVKVKDLIQLDINPRKISEDKKKKLVESLEKFNLVEIPAVNTDFQIIGGNQRVTALLLVGRGEEYIDVRFPNRKLTKKEVKEYAIISNTHAGEFDFEILDLEFSDISIGELGFEIDGWDDWKNKQDTLLAGDAQEDDFDVPVGGIETDIVLGDLFEIGEHRLLCGDSTDSDSVAKLMNGEKADMVFTDPPYNINVNSITFNTKIENDNLNENEFKEFIQSVISNIFLFCKGSKYICFDIREKSFINIFYENGMKSLIVWVKDIGQHHRENYGVKYELIAYFEDGAFYGENEENVWECKSIQSAGSRDDSGNLWFNGGSKGLTLHPTQKPILIPTRAINNSSKINDLVLDLFLGSGSTMVAAHQLKRKCYGMELDPKYCQVIIDRMIKLNPSIKITKNGKEWNTTKIS